MKFSNGWKLAISTAKINFVIYFCGRDFNVIRERDKYLKIYFLK
jgi:hypothetical protein